MIRSLTPIALSAVVISLAAHPAHALALFAGPYAPANWTQNIQGNGSINTGGAPNSITLSGANGVSGNNNTDFTIPALTGGIVSFDWAFSTADSDPSWDPFGYLLNGI